MRLISVFLCLSGLALALLGPLVWPGRLPVVLGAVCVLVAALLAARASRRRVWLALGGLAIAVAVFLAPGLANGWRNGRGIAWEVPNHEVVELAAAGYAITSEPEDLSHNDVPTTLIGRDIDSGARRWRITLPVPQDDVGSVTVEHVGQTLLVVDRDGALYALDLRTGKQRWATPPAGSTFPEVADAQTVAMLRCDERSQCTVEARALADGTVRWSAPAAQDNSFLGAPQLQRDASVTPPLWPAGFVIVQVPPDRARYEARDLRTGRVLASGDAKATATASIGNVLLRGDLTKVTATDVSSGRTLWRRSTEDGTPVRTVTVSAKMIAVVDGGMLLTREFSAMPQLDLGDPVRILDPRSGKVTEHRLGVSGYVGVYGTGTAAPGVPLVRDFGDPDDQLVVDGRHYVRERLDPFEIAATTTQAAFKSTLSVYGLGKRRAIEVYDRRGGRVVRFVAVNAHVRSAGERLVISVGDDDDRRSYVVSGR